MTEPREKRRLAAILAADVVGYSRLMGADEAGTLAALRLVWAQVFNPAVANHSGRVFKTTGDGALVEFASAVDAVDCAVAIQTAMVSHGQGGAASIAVRIGLNLGDVISEGEDIFGDGVNVAARLEAQAPQGGILLSDAIYAQTRGKVAAQFADAGELVLKNIANPVRAWRWGEGATPEAPKSDIRAAPDTPAVAVLPFTNMSNDPEQEYFSDGISEDIITDLSQIAGLMVVARNSSFAYKGQTPDIRAVGRALGVTAVLEGSVRRAGNRLRITAQLIDARSGTHLWADRYDRDMTDIFAVQNEVTLRIVGALRVTLQPQERARLAEVPTRSVEAHDLFLQGRAAIFSAVKDVNSFRSAVAAFEAAIAIDPAYAEPYAGLAITYTHDHLNGWTGAADALQVAARFSAIALERGPHDPYAHYVDGVVKLWLSDPEGARAACERALALSPNHALAHGALGMVLVYLGAPEEGLTHSRRALLLDPGFGHQTLQFMGAALLMLGRYDEAEATFRERIRLSPRTDIARAFLAATLGHLGRGEEARAVWAEMMALNPAYRLADHMARSPFRRPQDVAQINGGLGKARILALSWAGASINTPPG